MNELNGKLSYAYMGHRIHVSALELGPLPVYLSFLRVRGLRSITAGDPPGMDPYRLGSPACELPARGMGIPFLTVAFGEFLFACASMRYENKMSLFGISPKPNIQIVTFCYL